MDLIQTLRIWNPWWKKEPIETGTLRTVTKEITSTLKIRHVKDIIGVRRSGKTTVLYQIIDFLIKNGTNPLRIIFINFDDVNLKTAEIEDIEKAIYQINPHMEYLFLDEVQEKKMWERWVRKLYDLKRFKQIFITGSNASLLSKDIGRVLTGRHISSTLLPFSFKEFLKIKGWTNFNKQYLAAEKIKLRHYLIEYLKNGGFPETTRENRTNRHKIFVNIYEDILSKDISMRHSIDGDKINYLGNYLLTNFTNEFSYRRISNSLGINIETVERYISFLKEAFLVFTLNIFSFKIKTQFKQNKKIYCIDNGLRNAVSFQFSSDLGKLAENLVFLELKRRTKEVYYWKNTKGLEVDFVIKEGLKVKELIQVCWKIKEAKNREIKALLAGMNELKLKKGLIITEDKEGKEKIKGKTIQYIPLWKWLLQ